MVQLRGGVFRVEKNKHLLPGKSRSGEKHLMKR